MTICALALHIRALTHAGPLWRDEISSLQLATVPAFGEFFHWLVFDVFPILFFLLLRVWTAIGLGHTDFQLRLLGFFIGVFLLASIWPGCRLLNKESWIPLWPLALFAISPLVIHDGDSLRAYGTGMVCIILMTGFAASFVEHRNGRSLCLAALMAVLSVQTLYINAVLVFAICVGASVALAAQGKRRAPFLILGAGLPAALSLLPYVPFFRLSYDMRAMQRTHSTLGEIAAACLRVLSSDNPVVECVWILIAACAIAILVVPTLRRHILKHAVERHRSVFAIGTLLIAASGVIGFLWMSDWLAERYFLPFAAVAGLCLHLCTTTFHKYFAVRLANLVMSVAIAAIVFPISYAALTVRDTNCDLAAAAVSEKAMPNDMVIVTSFPFGITFERYYHGPARWRTVPDVSDHTMHRWDLAIRAMTLPDPMRDTRSQIEATLRSGSRVFLVGALPAPDSTPPEALPPVRPDAQTWKMYEDNWRRQIAYLLEQHAVHGNEITLETDQPINPLEEVGVFVVSGWHDKPTEADRAVEPR